MLELRVVLGLDWSFGLSFGFSSLLKDRVWVEVTYILLIFKVRFKYKFEVSIKVELRLDLGFILELLLRSECWFG